jgi:hypothetical protein
MRKPWPTEGCCAPPPKISALLSQHYTDLDLRLGTFPYIPQSKTTCQKIDLFPSSDERVQRLALRFCSTERVIVYLKTAVLWVITQRIAVIPYRRFETTYRVPFSGAKNQYSFGFSSPEDGIDLLYRNVGKQLPLLAP